MIYDLRFSDKKKKANKNSHFELCQTKDFGKVE